MRILFVTTYYAPDGGATATLLTRLATMLAARGYEVTVLAPMPHYPHRRIRDDYRGRFTMSETLDGVRVVRVWLWTTPSNRMSRRLISQVSLMFTLLIRGVFMRRPDVFFVESQPVFTGFAGQALAFLKRRRYVLDVSDLWPDHLLTVGALTETHPVYRVARALVNSTFRGARHIVALSPLWKSKIDGYIQQPHKTHTIYCGADLTRFSPQVSGDAFRAQHGLAGVKVVSFIGAFTTQNDFDTLFEAARLLRHRADIVFAFIGGGSLEHKQADAADLPNVRWLGWVEADTMPQAWAASDITLMSLRAHPLYEGIAPAKYFEAMACGVPIVAAARGIPAQMLTDSGAGVAVPNGDAAGMAESITRLVDDADFYAQCAQAGRAYAEAHFDPQRVTDAYEALLRDAVTP